MSGDPRADRPVDVGHGDRLWPAWVRVALLTVLVLWVGVGLVVLLYSEGILPIAGPFVALLVGPVIAVLGLRWRTRRTVTRLDDSLRRAAAEIERERVLGASERTSGLSDTSLSLSSARLADARTALDVGDLGRGVAHVDTLIPALSREVTSGSPLASSVDEIVSARAKLDKIASQAKS